MKTKWQTKKLGEVCDFQRGLTYSKKDEVDFSDNIVLRSNNVDLKSSTLDLSELRYVNTNVVIPDNKKTKKWSIITCIANGSKSHLGKIALIDNNYGYAFGGFMAQLTPNKEINSKYFFYVLTSDSYKDHLSKISNGTNINNLKFSDIDNFEIPVPSLPEQKRIVKTLDDVFEKLTKAKESAEKNLQNSKELFESYLKNLKGDKKPLGLLVDIRTGRLNANAMSAGGQYPFFTCAKEIYAIDKFAFDCEAILLAGNNAVGDFNVKHYKGKFNAYQRTYVITVNNENRILYRYLYFQLLKSLGEFKGKSVGAGTKFLKLGMIQNLLITLPSLSEQKSIVKKLDALSVETKKLEKIYKQKLADLEELKKSVLKKAFSGEL